MKNEIEWIKKILMNQERELNVVLNQFDSGKTGAFWILSRRYRT